MRYVLDLRTLTWSRVEAKALQWTLWNHHLPCLWRIYHGEISFSPFFGHTKDHTNTHVKAFDPLAYTWSILKTYGKAPIFDLPLLLKGKAANNFFIIAFVAGLPLFALTLIVELTLFSGFDVSEIANLGYGWEEEGAAAAAEKLAYQRSGSRRRRRRSNEAERPKTTLSNEIMHDDGKIMAQPKSNAIGRRGPAAAAITDRSASPVCDVAVTWRRH
ncbi:hypothetical protein Syun_002101 [Stephania yunnanensis]|uniref:Uncharacterized protein n=1 Tax=Stephania yunnanensis TaxID=152371 RepID=A0AAP0QBJ0_9MAGN